MVHVSNKLLLLSLAISISLNVCAQSFSEIENAKNKLENILHGSLSRNQPHLFKADIETIDSIIKRTSKRFKIVYNFSMTCHLSTELFPKLVDFVNNNNEFELFPIFGYREIDTVLVNNYLTYNKFFGNMFILDTEKYGNKKNPFNRIDKLTRSICKECDYKRMGFSSFYIFDENNNVALHNSWITPGLKKLEVLSEWYKKE